MVDRPRVDQLLALLAGHTRVLRGLAALPLDEFEGDPRNYGSAERFLQLAIETTLRIGNHVIAAEGLSQPDTYADVFRVLGGADVLPLDFAEQLGPMARMRNRLVHVYDDIDPAYVHAVLGQRLGDFDRFATVVTQHLDAREEPDGDQPSED